MSKNPKDSTTLPESAVEEPETYLTYEEEVKVAERLQPLAEKISKDLEKAVGKPVPFSLFTWGGQRAQYVANVARGDAMVAMKVLVDRWERHEPDIGMPGQDQEGPMQ